MGNKASGPVGMSPKGGPRSVGPKVKLPIKNPTSHGISNFPVKESIGLPKK